MLLILYVYYCCCLNLNQWISSRTGSSKVKTEKTTLESEPGGIRVDIWEIFRNFEDMSGLSVWDGIHHTW